VSSGNPLQTLAALPTDLDEAQESQWLQNTLAWLRYDGSKSVAPIFRSRRLQEFATGLEKLGMRGRVALIWTRAAPHRLLSDAALPEETSLLREISVRLKRRLMPSFERELDLYSVLDASALGVDDLEWIANLPEQDAAFWNDIVSVSETQICKALHLLAARVVAVGLSRDLAPSCRTSGKTNAASRIRP